MITAPDREWEARSDAADRLPQDPDHGVIRVLLVEDDEGDALLVHENLQDAAIDVELQHVRTLGEALGALDVDCVLLDLGLPDGVGIPALRRVLDAGAPAVVVLTGLSGDEAGMLAVAAGAQDYLVKDEVDGRLLARSVRYAVQRRRLEVTGRELYRSEVRTQESHRLERALLPRPVVTHAPVEVGVAYRAGRDGVLGGDFYDAVERPDGSVLVVVGDVCGHGPDEAALGATLRTAWRTLVLTGTPTGELFGLLERVLVAERAEDWVFTTMVMVEITADGSAADLYLAGHPEPLALGPEAAFLPTTHRGRLLGLPGPGRWDPARIELPVGWRLALYTDGVLEVTLGGSRERLGMTGFLEVAEGVRTQTAPDEVVPASVLAQAVLDEVRALHGGNLDDDAAVVVVEDRR
ncbi:PP2C family protein-serine/threonine phosphatase [Luteimicrobium subarcticum]|uniref:Serine phosphatase RsbU (Regulator of sigma subunit) n=1 Tax=Luteimicrobium subarcticum TaxID=620910 RepID=A0A2M8WU62_9MICO|nr:SpoIIE family protein phosphatase [Luteimicrobium subarcticum]PJI94480.1 serine phosphatase RsbU (regulator of sigma subunit) [Luteimicrobium subarcticum]